MLGFMGDASNLAKLILAEGIARVVPEAGDDNPCATTGPNNRRPEPETGESVERVGGSGGS